MSVTIVGTRLEGLTGEEIMDRDNGGLCDILSLGFVANIITP